MIHPHNITTKIVTNSLTEDDISAINAFHFFLSIPKSLSCQILPYKLNLKSATNGSTLFQNDVYELIPYKPTNFMFSYGDTVNFFLEKEMLKFKELMKYVCHCLNIEYKESYFIEESQILYSEDGLEWNKGYETLKKLGPNLENLADFFLKNDALNFKENFEFAWRSLSEPSKHVAALSILNTFKYTQQWSEKMVLLHARQMQHWLDTFKTTETMSPFTKAFAIHNIDRIVLLNKYVTSLVAKIN